MSQRELSLKGLQVFADRPQGISMSCNEDILPSHDLQQRDVKWPPASCQGSARKARWCRSKKASPQAQCAMIGPMLASAGCLRASPGPRSSPRTPLPAGLSWEPRTRALRGAASRRRRGARDRALSALRSLFEGPALRYIGSLEGCRGSEALMAGGGMS